MGVGPGTSNHFEAGGFICSSEDRPYPNVMFHFLPLAVRYDGSGGGTRCVCAYLPCPPSPSTSRVDASVTVIKCMWDQ